jgi:ATP synthase F0 subunit b
MKGGDMKSFLMLCVGLLGVGAIITFFPEWVMAAESGEVHHKAFSLKEEAFKFVNTLIVVAILYKVAAKPIRSFFKERSEGIRKALSEAEQARKDAELQLEEQRSKVADLEAELTRVREVGHKERQEMRVRLEADQEAQANRLLEQTRNAIELETIKARADLQDRAAEISLGLAEEILKKNIGPGDQARFVSNYLSKLEAGNGGSN